MIDRNLSLCRKQHESRSGAAFTWSGQGCWQPAAGDTYSEHRRSYRKSVEESPQG
jgi:hypothetical protein